LIILATLDEQRPATGPEETGDLPVSAEAERSWWAQRKWSLLVSAVFLGISPLAGGWRLTLGLLVGLGPGIALKLWLPDKRAVREVPAHRLRLVRGGLTVYGLTALVTALGCAIGFFASGSTSGWLGSGAWWLGLSAFVTLLTRRELSEDGD
jgi:hypothetical protein